MDCYHILLNFMDCIFCNIAKGKFNTNFLYEDSEIIAFYDVNPQAPTHVLIIPRQHIVTINDTDSKDELLLGKMILVAKQLAEQHHLKEPGYRLVFNVNSQGGQAVYHIHLHLLGGRQMNWPPG